MSRIAHGRATCLGCGSQLGGRYEGERQWGVKRVRVWRCGCKRRRMVEVAAR